MGSALAVEDHAPVMEHVLFDESAVGGETGVVPIVDVITAHFVAPLTGVVAGCRDQISAFVHFLVVDKYCYRPRQKGKSA